jgi:cathepsin L
MAIIRKHDSATEGYRIGVTKYADMSLEEFSKMMGLKEESIDSGSDGKFLEPEDEVPDFVDTDTADDDEEGVDGRHLQSYPASIDWRTLGALNPIRNQGSCGSCYAFSALSSLEAMYKVKKGTLPQLSEQQLVDCSRSYGNSGCSGGLMTNSFNYLKSYKSMSRSSYAYTAVAGTCKYNSMNGIVNTIGYKNIAKGDPNAHIAAL